MATDYRSSGDAAWNDASKWSTGALPTASDDAVITANGAYTVTVNAPAVADNLTLNAPGATLDLQNTLTLGGLFNLAAGGLYLDGGTLAGAQLVESGGSFATSNNGYSTLSDVAVQGDLAFNGGYLALTRNTTVSGAIAVTGASLELNGYSDLVTKVTLTGSNLYLADGGATTTVDAGVAILGSGQITDNDYGRGAAALANAGTITAKPGQTLNIDVSGGYTNTGKTLATAGADLQIYNSAITNSGLLDAENSTLYLDYGYASFAVTNQAGGEINGVNATLDIGGQFVNAGAINTVGGALNLGDNNNTTAFSNTGTITTRNTAIYLRGAVTTAEIGTIARTGGSITDYGAIDNTGATLDLTSGSLKDLYLDGGSITGGKLVQSAADPVSVSGDGNNRLSGVEVLGGLNLTSGLLNLSNGSTVMNAAGTAAAPISLTNASLDLDGYAGLVNAVTLSNANLYVDAPAVTTADEAYGLFNTGVDASGTTLPGGSVDPHFALAGPNETSSSAYVLSPANLYSGWAPDDAASGWIGEADSRNPGPSPYTFTETFTLTAVQAADFSLTGEWSVDDSGALQINGQTIATASTTFNGQAFAVTNATGLFHAGANTVTLDLTYGSQSTDGVRLAFGAPTTIDAGVVVQGTGSLTGRTDASLIENAGTIDADVSGGTLNVHPTGFINTALAEATNGGTLDIGDPNQGYFASTNWVNASGATISATGSTLNLSDQFTNEGLITATNSAVNLGGSYDESDYGRWINAGQITVSGGSLTLGAATMSADTIDSWSNTGAITTSGTSVVLRGDVTLADLGSIARTGGSITLQGVLDAQGGTVDTTQGLFKDLTLDGGTIRNAILVESAADPLNATGSTANTLNDVTVKGGLTLNSGYVSLTGGSTITDAAGDPGGPITVSNATAELSGYADLADTVTLNAGTLTLDAGTGSAGVTTPAGLFNTGVDAGGAALPGGSADPHFTVAGASVASGQAAVLTNLYSGWTPDNATSAWIGATDSVNPGQPPYTFSQTFNLSGDLSQVVLAGQLFIDNGGSLLINGVDVGNYGAVFNGQSFVVTDASGLLHQGANTIAVALTSGDDNTDGARLAFNAAPATTLDAASVVQGTGVLNGVSLLVNKGLIDADVAGGTLTVHPGDFLNEGQVEATGGGVLSIGSYYDSNGAVNWVNTSSGTITATGSTLNLQDVFTNAGQITATNSKVTLGGYYDYNDTGRWTNSGQISTTGGSLTLGSLNLNADTQDSWSNTGTITTNATAVTLAGSITLADVGTLNRTAGSLTLVGTLDAKGGTIDTTQGTFKDLVLSGGAIRNATLTDSAADPLTGTVNSVNTLDNVAVQGGVTLSSGVLNLIDGSTLAGPVTLSGSGEVNLVGATDLTDTVVLAGGYLAASRAAGGVLTVDAGVTVSGQGTFESPSPYYPNYNSTYSSDAAEAIDNKGTITADVTGATLTVVGGGLTNDALMQAVDGATLQIGRNDSSVFVSSNAADGTISADNSTLVLSGGFTNAGAITAANSTVEFGGTYDYSDQGRPVNTGAITTTGGALFLGATNHSGGSQDAFANTGTITAHGTAITLQGPQTTADVGAIQRSGGSLTITGTINNTGATIDTTQGTFADAILSGGAINNGTLIEGPGGALATAYNSNNVLSGVAVQGGLTVTSGLLNLTNATTVSGRLELDGSAAVNLSGYDSFSSNVTLGGGTLNDSLSPSGTFTLAAGATIQGAGQVYGEFNYYPYYYSGSPNFDNKGVINADVAGATLTVTPGPISNDGVLEASNGGHLTVGSNNGLGVSGTGAATITTGGVLEFQQGGEAGQTVSFTDATGTLVLDGSFQGSISGFAVGDQVVLQGYYDAGTETATYANGVVTIADAAGDVLRTLALNGDYSGDSFGVAGGGYSHTLTVAPTPPAPAAGVAQWDGTSNDWSSAADWSTGQVPTTATDVAVITPGPYTLTVSDAEGVDNLDLNAPGATLRVTGKLQVAGLLSVEAGDLAVAGGTIAGGDLSAAHGTLSFSDGTLDGVKVEGGLDVVGDAILTGGTTVYSDASRTALGAITVEGGGALTFKASGLTTLAQDVALLGGSLTADDAGAATTQLTIAAAGQVAGYGAIADGGVHNTNGINLVNDGLVSADVAGQSLAITFSGFTNNATLQAIHGATLVVEQNEGVTWTNAAGATVAAASGGAADLDGVFSNLGAITASDATLKLGDPANLGEWTNGGTITATDSSVSIAGQEKLSDLGALSVTGGVLQLVAGDIDGQGATLDGTGKSAALQNLVLNGGVLQNATLNQAALNLGFGANASSALSGVTVAGDLVVAPAAYVRLTGGTTVSGVVQASGTVAFDAGLGVASDVTLTNGAIQLAGPGATATGSQIDAGATVQGYGAIHDTQSAGAPVDLTNRGLIDARVATLTIDPAGFTNDATAEATAGGTLYIGNYYAPTTTAFTNAADGTVEATNASVDLESAFTNAGLIEGTNSALVLDGGYGPYNPTGFTNTGSVVETGGSLQLGDGAGASWSNTGSITTTNTAISLYGAITTADVGAISRTGGSLTLHGTLTNTGATVDVTQGTFAGLQLSSGAIAGGDLATGATSAFNGYGSLQGVTVQGPLSVTGGGLTLSGGTTVSGAIGVANATLTWNDITDLVNTVTLQNGTLNASSGALTIDAGSSVRGYGTLAANAAATLPAVSLDNKGLIEADVAGQSLEIDAPTFDNDATVSADNGGAIHIDNSTSGYYGGTSWTNEADGLIRAVNATLVLSGAFTNAGQITGANSSLDLGYYYDLNDRGVWSNSGSISVTGGSLTLGSQYTVGDTVDSWSNTGTISATNAAVTLLGQITLADIGTFNRTGGSLTLGGTLDGQGGTLDLTQGAFQGLQIQGGALKNATLNEGAGGSLTGDGTLDGVAVHGDLIVTGGTTTLVDGSTVSGVARVSNATLHLQGYNDLSFGVVLAGSTLTVSGSPSGILTVDAGVEVQGYGTLNTDPQAIENLGLINADVAGQTLTIDPPSFTNDGVLKAENGGVLHVDDTANGYNSYYTPSQLQTWTNNADGTIVVTASTLQLSGQFTNAGQVTGTNSSVAIGGDYDYGDAGVWSNSGTISVSGGQLYLGSPNLSQDTKDSWSNTGTISAANAAVYLRGSISAADLGTFQRTGGSVTLNGTLNETGATLDVSQGAFDDLILDGGTVVGGTLVQSATDTLSVSGNSANTLDGVAVRGGLTLNGGYLKLIDGTAVQTASGAAGGPISLSSASLELRGYSDLTSSVSLFASNLYGSQAGGQPDTLTIDAGVTVQGVNSNLTDNPDGDGQITLVNAGTIMATGGTLAVDPATLTNTGLLQAAAGATLFVGTGYYYNTPAGFTNLASGVLTGGAYEADSNAALILGRNLSVTSDAATITLSGPGSNAESYLDSLGGFATLDTTLTSVAAGGELDVLSGRGFGAGANAFSDAGVIKLAGGTFSEGATTIAAGGRFTGSGLLSAASLDDEGTIIASGGLLRIAEVVTGAGGLGVAKGATLELAGAATQTTTFGGVGILQLDAPASYAGPITGLVAGDAIDLFDTVVSGDPVLSGDTLTVQTANGQTLTYTVTGPGGATLTNAAFQARGDGAGGSLLVLASTGAKLAQATINTPDPLTLSNVRVGAPDLHTLDISNTAAAPADGLNAASGAVTGDASVKGGFTGLAPAGDDATDLTVGLSTATAGAKSGTAQVQFTSDGSVTGGSANLPTQTVTLAGKVYNAATGVITSAASQIVHVGDDGGSLTEHFDVSNSAPAGAYSEALTATVTGETGSLGSASGATGDIAAGSDNASAVTAAFSTAAAGVLTGSVQLDLQSDGAGVDGLTPLDLGVQSASAQVTVLNYATAAFTDISNVGALSGSGAAYTLNLGTVLQGSTPLTVQIGAQNSAGGPADTLTGTLATNAGNGFSNAVSAALSQGLGAGASVSIGSVALQTGTTGSFSETVTLTGTGSNASGYSAALASGPVTLTITGAVAGASGAQVNTTSPVTIANQRVGATPALTAISVTNAAAAPADGLDASIATPLPAALASNGGTISNLAPGSTDATSLKLGVATTTAGHADAKATLDFASDDGAGHQTGSSTQQIEVTGSVYREGAGTISTPAAKVVHVGDNGAVLLSLQNIAAADGYSEGLKGEVTGVSGALKSGFGTTAYIAPGSSDGAGLNATFDTSKAGVLNGTVDIEYFSEGGVDGATNEDGSAKPDVDGLGEADIGGTTAQVSLTVDNYAVAQIEQLGGSGALSSNGQGGYTLNLGSTQQGGAAMGVSFGVLNAALGQADALAGSFASPTGDTGAYSNGGLGSFSGLGAGQVAGLPTITLSSTSVGTYSETFVLNPTASNASGYNSTLGQQTVTITGTVLPAPPPPVIPGPVGEGWGDVHFVTFDGLRYDFQAEGEFVLAQSTVAGDSFEVQIRAEPYSPGSTVSVTTAVAASLGGGHKVTFATGRANLVQIDGSAATGLSANSPLTVGDATITELSPTQYSIAWTTGETATIADTGSYFNTTVQLSPGAAAGSVKGLLGSFSGSANDFQLADGTVIPQPIASTDLYGEFAQAWRLTDADSLMDYGSGQTTATFTDVSFPTDQASLANLPSALVDAAEQKVKAAGITDPNIAAAAALDFLVTGNPNALTGSKNVQSSVSTTGAAAVSATVVTSPGAGVTAPLASVTQSSTATTAVNFNVYLTSAAAADTTLTYTVIAPDAGELGAASFGGTLPSGQVTIAAGQTGGQFAITLPADVLGQQATSALEVQILAPAGTPVFAPTAQTEIVNDQPAPGPTPLPLLGLLAGAGTLTHTGNSYTLNIGSLVQGESAAPLHFALLNAAASGSDDVAGTLAAGSGDFTLNGLGTLAAVTPGASYDALFATPVTANLGVDSQVINVSPTDTNQTGYDAALSPLSLTITDDVLAPAVATVNPGSAQPTIVALGVIRGGPVPTGASSTAITIANTAAAGASNLDAQVVGLASGATAAGVVSNLAPGASDGADVTVGLDTSTGGVKSGTVTLSFSSDAGGGNTLALPNQAVTVTGTVYEEGQAGVAPVNAVVHPGASASQAITVTNLEPASAYSEGVALSVVSAVGSLAVSGSTGDIAGGAGDSGSIVATLPTDGAGALIAGVYSSQVTFDEKTDGTGVDGYGQTDLGQITRTVTIAVSDPATLGLKQSAGPGTLTQDPANPDSYTLNLGTFAEGPGFVTGGLSIANTATGTPSDTLSGNIEAISNAGGKFVNGGFQAFNLAAGQSDSNPQVAFATSTAGAFSETLQINSSSVYGRSAVGEPTRTITVVGAVEPVKVLGEATTVDVGDDGTVLVDVTNQSTSDTLVVKEVGFTPSIGSAGGTTTALAPGAEQDGAIAVHFDTNTAGTYTGQLKLDVFDKTTNTDLGDLTATVGIVVDNPAVAKLVIVSGPGTLSAGPTANSYVYDLGQTTQYSNNLIGSLGVTNAGASPADVVGGTFDGPAGPAEYLNQPVPFGPVSNIGSGQTAFAGLVDLTTEDVGTFSETVTLHPTSTLSDGTVVALPDQTVTIMGKTGPQAPAPTPPNATGVAWGDVHLTTFDNLIYNFQAQGEFVLAKATAADDSFEVQVRLQPYGSSASVTVMTQVAAQVGADRVTFGIGRNSPVNVNGVAANLAGAGASQTLGDGVLQELSSTEYKITWTTGEVLEVDLAGAYINTNVTLAPSERAGSVQGLLGSDSGPATDFVTADGSPINPGDNTTITTAQLYGAFADAWRVTDANTLFDYTAGQSTESVTNRLFPFSPVDINSLPANVLAAAEKIVSQSGITDPALQQAALTDLLATGDPGIVSASQNVQQTGLAPSAATVNASTAAAASVGVSAQATSLTETAGADTLVSFTAYLTVASSSDTVVDYTAAAPDGAYLDASAFGGTLPSGQVTIAAGQTSATFSIDVPAAALGSAPNKTLGVAISLPSGESNPIFAPSAQTALVNAQPEAGPLATPQISVLNGGGTPTVNGSATTVDLGAYVLGETASVQLGVSNGSAAPSDALTGTVTDGGGFGAASGTGGLPNLAAGQSYQGVHVALATGTAGQFSDTLTLAPVDTNATGYKGALGSQTLTLTDTVLAPAQAVLGSASPINLGAVRIDATGAVTGGSATQALGVSNGAAAGAAALDASLGVASGPITATGVVSSLAAGDLAAGDLTVGIATSSDGAKTGVATLSVTSDAGGGHTLAASSQTVTVEGSVYNQVKAALTAPQVAIVHVGDTVQEDLTLANTAVADGYSEGLRGQVTGVTGAITASGVTGLIAAGASDASALTYSVSTAAAGVYTGSISTDLVSDGSALDGLSALDLGTTSTPVSVTVDNYAVAAITKVSGAGTLTQTGTDSYTLDFGTLAQGSGPAAVDLEALNAASGPADLLSGSFSASNTSGFTNTGLTAFSGLGAGGADTAPVVSLATDTAGQYSETLTLTPTGSNASGYSGSLAPVVLTLVGDVKAAGQALALTSGPDAISAGATAATITATDGTLSAGDQIDGGTSGRSVLALQGQGIFDLRAPATLADLPTVTATEGQVASGAIASTAQDVYLRDGLDTTLDVSPDPSVNTANPNAPGIAIYGAANADVINLGSGTDSVHLGGAAETVNGGGGTALIFGQGAELGATINGGAGTTLLYVDGGGTETLGAHLTGVSRVYLLAPPSGDAPTAFTANAEQGLQINDDTGGGDTLTLGDASQVVTLGTGVHTIEATASTAGAAIYNPQATASVLEVSGGGAFTVAPVDFALTVKLDQASTVTLNTYGVGVQGSAGDDTIVAGYGALTGLTAIDGGAGTNTLQLSGGGIFDLRAPASLTNITTITAAEGQGEYRSADGSVNIVGAEPIIFLRDGMDSTVQLASVASVNGSNPHPSGAIVYGADNKATIDLGSGTDTVYVGGAGETVVAGGGDDIFYATAATIGATLDGGTGHTDLFLSGGGTTTMGASITNIATVLLTAPTAGEAAWDFSAGGQKGLDIVDGSSGDIIRLGDVSQTVLLEGGDHTVTADAATSGAAVLTGGGGKVVLEITDGGAIAVNAADANLTVRLDQAATLTLNTNGIGVLGSAGDDTIVAGYGALTATSAIDGGAGINTLALSGGGIFDLRAPASITNIAQITATEGQGEYRSADGSTFITGSEPIIYLRDGMDAALTLASAASTDSANPHASGAIVYGASNAAVITLGSGADTVYVGGAGETVHGGGGDDIFYATGATVGATLDGGTGSTTLILTGGGTATLGANVTDIAKVVLSAAPSGATQPAWNFTANAEAGLVIDDQSTGDTLTLGDASQTVLLSAGDHHIDVTAATAGAAVLAGASGSNVLEIAGGGVAVLNGSDARLNVVLDQATDVTLSSGAGMTATGSSGADTLTAGAAGQTLTGGGGADTLVSSLQGGDLFKDTTANLNGVTVKGFATAGNTLDLTDLASGGATTRFTEDASNSFGTLTVGNGAKSASLILFGQFSAAGFQTASDGGGMGTAVSYTPPVQPNALAMPGH